MHAVLRFVFFFADGFRTELDDYFALGNEQASKNRFKHLLL